MGGGRCDLYGVVVCVYSSAWGLLEGGFDMEPDHCYLDEQPRQKTESILLSRSVIDGRLRDEEGFLLKPNGRRVDEQGGKAQHVTTNILDVRPYSITIHVYPYIYLVYAHLHISLYKISGRLHLNHLLAIPGLCHNTLIFRTGPINYKILMTP